MPTVTLSPVLKQQFWGNDGKPLVGGLVFTYLAGTATKTPTYSDPGGTSQNTNPIELDFRGEANIYIEPNKRYKFVLAPKNDTDPPTNPIWTIDDATALELLTLYAGTDTGVANAYVLTISLPQSAYTDGTLLIWIPSNTNTAASTVNVNGLGPVAIVNADGSPLVANEIQANVPAEMVFRGGSFVLLNPQIYNAVGSVALTPFGLTTAVAVNVRYQRYARQITLTIPTVTGMSDATSFGLTGLPAFLRTSPGALQVRGGAVVATNNSVITYAAGAATIAATVADIAFEWQGSPTGWTATGTKTILQHNLTYWTDSPYF